MQTDANCIFMIYMSFLYSKPIMKPHMHTYYVIVPVAITGMEIMYRYTPNIMLVPKHINLEVLLNM